MFSRLFDMLPDAEHLLSLSAEELAGPLLVSFEDRDRIIPENIIGYDNLEIERNRNPNLNFLHGNCEEVLFALMEAWQCLVSERFVAPRPTNLASEGRGPISTTIYFVTRKGQKIETLEDYEAYRKTDFLRKHQLHPIIAEKVWFIFAQGSYGTAVLEAFKQVEIAVRKAGGYSDNDYGTNLMRNAFHTDDSKLIDKNQHQQERQARYFLFAGAIGSYKNPSSHREVEYAPEEAAEIIIFASHLLRIVDTCEERISNSST